MNILRLPLSFRIGIFLLFFCALSGFMGSWIIAQQTLLYPFHFDIYGGAGKVLVFGVVAFVILTRNRILTVDVPKFSRYQYLVLLSALLLCIPFFYFAPQLLAFRSFTDAVGLSLLVHLLLLLSVVCALVGSFGFHLLRTLLNLFYREIGVCFTLSVTFFFLFSYIFRLWPYLSQIVLVVVTWLLSFSFPTVRVHEPLTIVLPQFAVTIAQYCSGIESLFLFSALYILIGLVDWQVFNHKKFVFMYIPLVLGLFLVNILRVYIIILSGVFISPQVAAKLFHTYLGMIFFIVYFGLFWMKAYKWMRQ